MKTIAIHPETKTETKIKGNFLTRWHRNQEIAFEESRFGRMVIFLTAQSCLGSVAAMFALQNHAGDWALITAAAVTMWSNSMFIAQASAKWCLLIFYMSLIVNTTLILMYV